MKVEFKDRIQVTQKKFACGKSYYDTVYRVFSKPLSLQEELQSFIDNANKLIAVWNENTIPVGLTDIDNLKTKLTNISEMLRSYREESMLIDFDKEKAQDLDGRCHFCGKINERCFCERS